MFCNGSVRQKDMPKLPDQFTTGLEMTHLHTIGNNSFTVKSTEQVSVAPEFRQFWTSVDVIRISDLYT